MDFNWFFFSSDQLLLFFSCLWLMKSNISYWGAQFFIVSSVSSTGIQQVRKKLFPHFFLKLLKVRIVQSFFFLLFSLWVHLFSPLFIFSLILLCLFGIIFKIRFLNYLLSLMHYLKGLKLSCMVLFLTIRHERDKYNMKGLRHRVTIYV